jgi:hypothetical protein
VNLRHAEAVVDQLHRWSIRANTVPRGLDHADVRVILEAGCEAVWSADAASGLRAQVLRDGILINFVPELDGSQGLSPEAEAWLIAKTDYRQGGSRAATPQRASANVSARSKDRRATAAKPFTAPRRRRP